MGHRGRFGGETEAVQRQRLAGGGRATVQHGAWCRRDAGLAGALLVCCKYGLCLTAWPFSRQRGVGARYACECRDMLPHPRCCRLTRSGERCGWSGSRERIYYVMLCYGVEVFCIEPERSDEGAVRRHRVLHPTSSRSAHRLVAHLVEMLAGELASGCDWWRAPEAWFCQLGRALVARRHPHIVGMPLASALRWFACACAYVSPWCATSLVPIATRTSR